jgi:hypothetical protein
VIAGKLESAARCRTDAAIGAPGGARRDPQGERNHRFALFGAPPPHEGEKGSKARMLKRIAAIESHAVASMAKTLKFIYFSAAKGGKSMKSREPA